MAVFNPDVPNTQPGDWTNISKPVSDIQADKSTGIALAGAGDLISSATKIADTWVKENINEDVRTNVDRLRDEATASYEISRNQQTLAPETPQIPGGLQAGLERVNALGQAQAQSGGGTGKANDTLYTAALNSYAKQLRNQYPGYRDYIDSKIQQVSGIDPANAYMRNLLEDINRNSQSQKGEVDKAVALGRQYLGYDPNMPAYIEAVRQGIPGAVQNLENQINKAASVKVMHDNAKARNDQKKWGQEEDRERATEEFRQLGNATAFNTFNTVLELPGLTNPSTIQDLINKSRNGQITLSPEQWVALDQQAQGYYEKARMTLLSIANNGDTAFARRMGNDRTAINAQIEDMLMPYKMQVEAIRSKDFGLLYGVQRRVAAQQDTAQAQVLASPMGTDMLMTQAVTKFVGPQIASTVLAQTLMNGVPSKYKSFVEEARKRAILPEQDLRQMNQVKSLYEDVVAAQKAKIPGSSRVYDQLVDNVNLIVGEPPKGTNANQHQAMKKEVVEYTFNPEKNANLINTFAKGFTDDKGVFHPGKEAFYDTMTRPDITDSIYKMKDGESWGKYKNWQETSFAQLFRDDVIQLNKLAEDKSMDVKVVYDSDIKQFAIQYPKVTTGVEARYQDSARATVANINRGLKNLAYMKDKENTDTSAYLFEQLTNLGFSPNDNMSGLPAKMMSAIANSKLKKGIEEAYRAAGGNR